MRRRGHPDIDDLREIRKRPRQPINLVDNDDLNLASLDIRE
jgi:hypothetical protein